MGPNGGTALGERYEITGVLGEGSMGVVYDAIHRALGRPVAIKMLRAELISDPEAGRRFEVEARAVGALGHPNLVQVLDAGVADGARYLVMERIDGGSLAERIAAGMLPIEAAVDLGVQILAGLHAAHRRGIVHRDLKPENVLLARDDDGRVVAKVVDFGVSKVIDAARLGAQVGPSQTVMGTLIGTPLYMAPEQGRGEVDVDARVDLWATGCVLFEMLTGRPPFLGDAYPQILGAILADPPPSLRGLRPDVPAALEAVVVRALAKSRGDRYADAAEMRVALRAALDSPQKARPAAAMAPTLAMPPQSSPVARTLPDPHPPVAGMPARADLGTPSPFPPPPRAEAEDADALMLAALSRAVDHELGSVGGDAVAPPPAPRPAPAAAAAPAAARRSAAPAAAAAPAVDPFAPPAENGPMELVLDVALPADRPSQAMAAARPRTPAAGGAAAARTTTGRAHVRPRRSSAGAVVTAIKLLLGLAVLGAAGLAAYRYFTLGYIGKAPPPPPVALAVAVNPDDADVTLDGAPLAGDASVAQGSRHALEASSPGRLGVRVQLAVGKGPLRYTLRLPRALAHAPRMAVGPRVSASPPPSRLQAELAEVDREGDKLAQYGRCLGRLRGPLEAAAASYATTSKGLSPSHLPTVVTLPGEVVEECRAEIDAARSAQPALTEVDQAASAAAEAILALDGVSRRMSSYYGRGENRVDDLKLGRARHGELLAAYTAGQKTLAALDLLVEAELDRTQRRELEALRAGEGESLHVILRTACLAARDLATAASPAIDAAAREALARALPAVKTAVGTASKGPEAELLALLAAPPTTDLADWHDRLVDQFNLIVVWLKPPQPPQ